MAKLSAQVVINNQTYNLIYNDQTGYYETTIDAPNIGGVYDANITYYDVIEDAYTTTRKIQVLEKEAIEVKENKNFLWLFDYQTFAVKDIVEIASYEIIIDEETNENSTIKVLKQTDAKANDIIAIKRNNNVVYWGIISEIQNEDGKTTSIFVTKYITNMFDRKVELGNTELITQTGIEDYIKAIITNNYINSDDTLMNLAYLTINAVTHTPKQVSVSNVENDLYNLHTWMTNCTQNYNIMYNFSIDETNNLLVLDIEVEDNNTELIDVKAMNITNYQEVFETDIVAKVIAVNENSSPYTLYLKTDRTTTTNKDDPNRAFGKVEMIYVANADDMPQEALNVMKGNSYNHNISFSLDRYIPIGTPIAIKTQKSIVYDTYISSIKITSSKFYDYQCGNIRVNFIEKLLKERNK